MSSLESVLRYELGEAIMAMSGVAVKVPNMANGRCFVSSLALSDASLAEVKTQKLLRRNETGVPILSAAVSISPAGCRLPHTSPSFALSLPKAA